MEDQCQHNIPVPNTNKVCVVYGRGEISASCFCVIVDWEPCCPAITPQCLSYDFIHTQGVSVDNVIQQHKPDLFCEYWRSYIRKHWPHTWLFCWEAQSLSDEGLQWWCKCIVNAATMSSMRFNTSPEMKWLHILQQSHQSEIQQCFHKSNFKLR